MGRSKVRLEKIEDNAKRQVTFSKRHGSLFKKAYELSVLCDIDVALIYFSTTGKLHFFSGRSRIEDVLIRFLNGPDQQVAPSIKIPNKESLVVLLENLKVQEDQIAGASSQQENLDQNRNKAVEDVDQELVKCQNHLDTLKGYLRLLYSDEPPITSLSEFHERSRKIMEILSKVKERKNYLLNLSAPSPCSMPFTQMWLQEQQSNILLENVELVHTQPQEDIISTMHVPPQMECLDLSKGNMFMQLESYSMDSLFAEVDALQGVNASVQSQEQLQEDITTIPVPPQMESLDLSKGNMPMQLETDSMASLGAQVNSMLEDPLAIGVDVHTGAARCNYHAGAPLKCMVGLSTEDPFLGLIDSPISFDSQKFLNF